jgi:alkylation response protein AidB-like acyl-CoA dehydrogenase
VNVDPALLTETPEQAELRAVVRDLLADGEDDKLWARLAGEVGVHGLAIPEQYGGSGYTFAELAVVLEETGRALACAALLPTVVLAGHTLLNSGNEEACERYLPRIADGTLTATVAGFVGSWPPAPDFQPTGGHRQFRASNAAQQAGSPAQPERKSHSCSQGAPDFNSTGERRHFSSPQPAAVQAERVDAGWVLRGSVDFVLDGQHADLILVRAGERIFALDSTVDGWRSTPRRVLDGTRPQALLEFFGAPVTPLCGAEIVDVVLDIGRAALAAEQVGGIAHVLDATVSYVRQRHQFDRAIGSFQAVKHRLADLLVEFEAARSASAYATASVVTGAGELPVAASAAAVVCSASFQLAAAEYVQLHGGIGFTWEHPAHRYVRRARGGEVLLGDQEFHRARLAALVIQPS